MWPNPDTCYRAAQARDVRFDGHFFVGVASTRIYCRPVCTAQMPRREGCSFYPSAAAAEARGLRPCLRCRPELAPGQASVDAARRLAHAAARLVEEGQLEGATLGALAAHLHVSDRHLRRVFRQEFGVSPAAYAQTQRLLLAKQLLTDTALPVTELALASGFGSLRRFNAVFRERYRLTPSQLRRSAPPASDALSFELAYRPPYDWAAMLAFLGARALPGVESVHGDAYRRTVQLGLSGVVHSGWLEVRPSPHPNRLRLTLAGSLLRAVPTVLARVKHLLDLHCQPDQIARVLGLLAAARPGLRLPGTFDGFELGVRAVLGQQVSVAAANTLAGRIAARCGPPIQTPFPELSRLFPTPADLLAADLSGLGLLPARARSLLALAGAVEGGLELRPGADTAATLARLLALPGIGDWTAQYVAMRALAWPDAFPSSDLGVLRALGETCPDRARAAAERWRPWRAYAVMHLWARLHPPQLTAPEASIHVPAI